MLEVFARERFYEERPELEEVLHGILRAVPVREGPNTRSLPFALATPDGDYGVYVSGVDEASLQPFVGREVTVRGKLIDQSVEGYGVEVWMASISVRTE